MCNEQSIIFLFPPPPSFDIRRKLERNRFPGECKVADFTRFSFRRFSKHWRSSANRNIDGLIGDQRPNLSTQFVRQSGHVSRAGGLEVQRTCKRKDFAHSSRARHLFQFCNTTHRSNSNSGESDRDASNLTIITYYRPVSNYKSNDRNFDIGLLKHRLLLIQSVNM